MGESESATDVAATVARPVLAVEKESTRKPPARGVTRPLTTTDGDSGTACCCGGGVVVCVCVVVWDAWVGDVCVGEVLRLPRPDATAAVRSAAAAASPSDPRDCISSWKSALRSTRSNPAVSDAADGVPAAVDACVVDASDGGGGLVGCSTAAGRADDDEAEEEVEEDEDEDECGGGTAMEAVRSRSWAKSGFCAIGAPGDEPGEAPLPLAAVVLRRLSSFSAPTLLEGEGRVAGGRGGGRRRGETNVGPPATLTAAWELEAGSGDNEEE
jgi:hypothetical protein